MTGAEGAVTALMGVGFAVLLAGFMWASWTERFPETWGEFFTRHGWRKKR